MVFPLYKLNQLDNRLELLVDAVSRCLSGSSEVVLVDGPVGCGKTHVLELAAAHAATTGAVVLKLYGSSADADAPLGTLRQLLDHAGLPQATVDQLRCVLENGAQREGRPTGESGSPAGGTPCAPGQGAREFKTAVLGLSNTAVVICVDELHHVDPLSLRYLMHLATPSQTGRVLLLFAQPSDGEQKNAVMRAEILRQPNSQRLRLGRLSRDGVQALLATGEDLPASTVAAHYWCQVSGGNPLLLAALMEDHRALPPERRPTAEPVLGEAFTQAVMTCVYRSGRTASRLAEGMAVLGASATPELLGVLMGIAPAAVARGLTVLESAGLVQELAFRTPHTEAAVLDHMDLDVRLEMHRRSAHILHRSGAATLSVARHLLAAQSADEPWAVPVLQDAANQALTVDDAKLAVACLELAYAVCDDADLRAGIRISTAAVMWRFSPSASERLLEGPLAVLRSGELSAAHLGRLIELLVAHGRMDEARSAHGQFETAMSSADPEALAQFRMNGRWAQVPSATPQDAEEDTSPAVAAEQVLQFTPLTDTTLETIINSVNALLFANQLEQAGRWCESLIRTAKHRKAPGWQATFAALRADIALRLGNLTEAERFSTMTLECVPEWDGSVLIGGALATTVLAYTGMGKHELAARQLSRPVPEVLFRSVYGLRYTRARGRYYLATHRFTSALGEFLMAGKLAQHWDLDLPTLLPWRSDAAEAWLQMGETGKAEALLTEQLDLLGPDDARVRGISLRLLGTFGDLTRRCELLTEAAEELHRSGDRLELAKALHDLGQVHCSLGNSGRAGALIGRARQLARKGGAEEIERPGPPVAGVLAKVPAQGSAPEAEATPVGRMVTVPPRLKTRLTDSEARVVALAVDGHTNREIAASLYITISTVEQHLTRVYRKLDIRNRQDLSARLQLESGEIS